ncbi:hypothetical protein IB237_03340 [Agrobacterium sp. AGB01]|uniref:hypothetical protein n=1 Tax=Agrobacterium sp. AGB01 TaxID=2769302 RepID=UPI001785F343|nr:hypothetical protein [Agrobacterium sp. AGB01]MBD9386201.1 hypothetical protein [Agrobacterium sp. AGB01]
MLSKTKSFQAGLFVRVIKAARVPALALCSVAAMTFGGSANAMDEVALKAAMASFGEAAQAQRLENEIAAYVKSGDLEKLTQLAEDIQAKDGEFLNILTLIVEQQEQDVSEELALMAVDPHQIALQMGPCHHANIAIRSLALMIADGAEPTIRNDVVMVDGTQLDNVFAETINRCERIKGLPQRVPQIGSLCMMTGNCSDDPDLAPQP